MNQIELKALAKINLCLDVLGRRENGYHDVRMVMQSIYLYDEVKIAKKKESWNYTDNKSEVSSNRGWQYRLLKQRSF